MSHPIGVFREIFVSTSRELAPFGLVFSYPPENFEQRQLGTVFGIIKISDTSPESSFVANLLASVIKKEYFSKPERPAYDSFEASLRKANLALAELARQGSVKWMGKISFAGGALEKNNLHFSKLGATSILLLRSGMLADIGASLDSDPAESGSHPLKTFSDISSGKVEKGDCLIFTTSDLLEIFSLEEIRQNAAGFSREEFPDIISASLTTNSELSGTIIVNLVSEEKADLPSGKKEPIPFRPAPAVRPPKAFSERRPDGLKNIRPLPASSTLSSNPAFSPISAPKKENSLRVSESDRPVPRKTSSQKAAIFSSLAANGAKKSFLTGGRLAKSFFRKIDWKKIFLSVRPIFLSAKQKTKKIDWKKRNTQIFSTGGAALILILITLPLWRDSFKRNAPDNQSSPAPTAEISSSPALDGAGARNIENISLVAALPSDSRELLFLNDSLFALSEDKSILKINPANGEIQKATSELPSGKFALAAAMPDLNTIFILTTDKKVISFTPINKKFQENDITFPGNLNAADMKTYLTYLYILDPSANQIYRYPRAENGFGEGQNWLKNGADVKNFKSLGINDDLFTASGSQIAAFLQGRKDEKTNFENPETPLSIDKILTEPDFESIYVLESKNHRIITYSKDGKITARYSNSEISAVKDFAVDEKNKTIYLQKSDSLSKFPMK